MAECTKRPRDAATLVIVDRTVPGAPRVLMGRRRPDQIFLPDTFVFPGGRVEPQDRLLARRHMLPPGQAEQLKIGMRGRPSDTRAAALALAALRETFEETGIVVGAVADAPSASRAPWTGLPAELTPRLDGLAFFARAITPPGRPRRYDTRFFIVDATHVAHRATRTDGELLDIGWFTLARAGELKLPSITRHVLKDVETMIDGSEDAISTSASASGNGVPKCRPVPVFRPVPFYKHVRGRLERTLISCAYSPP